MPEPIRIVVFDDDSEQVLPAITRAFAEAEQDMVVVSQADVVKEGALINAVQDSLAEDSVVVCGSVPDDERVKSIILGAGPSRRGDFTRVIRRIHAPPDFELERPLNEYPKPRVNKRAHYRR